MKKSLLFFAAILSITASFANTHKIKVSNFQFSPATTNAVIGDTILFVWVSGTHTTTSTSIPTGAASWDEPMSSTDKKFRYVVTKKGTYNFICTIHSSMMGKIKVSKPMAAGLLELNINTDGAKALLNWNINSGKDLSYFSVQRSTDGQNFTEVSKINSSAINNYQYADQSNLSEKYYYYQVEMFDKNGNSELSEIKMFSNSSNSTKLVTSISPNPVSSPGHLMLQFNADAEGKMLVQLYTAGGTLIKQVEMAANKGLNNGHFHLGDLKAGSYYIMCTLDNVQEKHMLLYK